MTDEEEYRGPAVLRLPAGGSGGKSGGGKSGEERTVEVRMSARFEPVEGRFRWAGRTEPDDTLRERVSGGLRQALIVIDNRETPVKLSEPDPWGGVRISGTGTPPWYARQERVTRD
ncbi:DUF4873 domain-containing protein [Actinoplanes sp. DH11]|uniref:DUF4873 domain-containing protein n=1 Tax=Actinoplanes sp. DH11 TaxID=2857011 RepID=UPI001E283BF3|nr:DUF4873 domain-containing protein [Actinoplanes sp. DH11]